MDRLLASHTKPASYSKQLVKEKLAIQDNDLEIETSTLKVSLLCPLMKCRIKTPGRSILCKHVQCFDVTSYLTMNEKKPTWVCPVCDRIAHYDELFIDG
jgi:E3 SUMO-protein ligase PIAS1